MAGGASSPDRPVVRLLYLFTTFPVLTETFLQREVRALRSLGVEPEIHSLWKGEDSFEGLPIRRFRLYQLAGLLLTLPYWAVRRPLSLAALLGNFLKRPAPYFQNLQENALGLGVGILLARRIERNPPDWIHCAWATMPATAALAIHTLTGARFSTGAHAYDLFQCGGDWTLASKLAHAAWIHTSTIAGERELLRRGVPPDRILRLRRGLFPVPPSRSASLTTSSSLRLLNIGRLVPKKDQELFLRVAAELRRRGLAATPIIIGEGPERTRLHTLAGELDFDPSAVLIGSLTAEATQEQLARASLLCFTGQPAQDGDRDGLPNVIPEAMALGVPVVAADQPSIREALTEGATGTLVADRSPAAWADAIEHRLSSPDGPVILQNARRWVEEHFDARVNTGILLERIRASIRT